MIWTTYWCFHEETNVGVILRCPSLTKSLSRALSSWSTVLFTAPSYHTVVARVFLNRTRSGLVFGLLLYYLGQSIQTTRSSGQLYRSGSSFKLGQSVFERSWCSWCITICKSDRKKNLFYLFKSILHINIILIEISWFIKQ